MLERKHWLSGSSFLPLLNEAVQSVERDISDRLDRRGELDRPEPTITTVLIENLQARLDAVRGNLRDLQNFRANQPAVSRFDFTVCDMQSGNRDVLGADLAFIFRTRWQNEFITRRGILLQAKRLGPLSQRTIRRLDEESRRVYGMPLEAWEEMYWHMVPRRFRVPPLRRARAPWPYLPSMLATSAEDIVLGDFPIDTDQLDFLLSHVVSSYYLFYDYPIPHMTLPCVQALTIKGLVDAGRSSDIYRSSVLRHAMPLTELLVHEFVGCRIGEWNWSFAQLEAIADQNRVGPIETPQGDFNVHAYNVSYTVVMEITLIPSPYEAEGEQST
jgi:hypothetical protein